MDAVSSLILKVSEMLKIPKTKVEVHFLKKQDAFRKCPRTTENLQNTQQ